MSVEIAEMWVAKLTLDFPDDTFIVILTFDEKESESILRFHKIRDNQAPWVDYNEIEEYTEPMMVFFTSIL